MFFVKPKNNQYIPNISLQIKSGNSTNVYIHLLDWRLSAFLGMDEVFNFAKLIVLYGNQIHKIHWVYLLTLYKFNQKRICSNKNILWLNNFLTGFNV